MFDQKRIVLTVLLLAAPLAALAGPEPTAKLDAAAAEVSAQDITAPLVSKLLLATPFQVLVNSDELLETRKLPVIVVEGKDLIQSSPATENRCGLRGIAWAIKRPAEAWREVALVPADSNGPACLRAAAAIERTPDALAPVRWYQ